MTTKQTSPTNGMIIIPAAEYMGISIVLHVLLQSKFE